MRCEWELEYAKGALWWIWNLMGLEEQKGENIPNGENNTRVSGRGMLSPFAQASTFSLDTIRFINANKAQGQGQYSVPTYV